MRKWMRKLAAGAALLGAAATACSGSAGETAANGDTVRIGIFPGDPAAPWEIADRQGFFAKQGINVKFVEFTSGPAIMAALISGSIDIGYGGSGVVYQQARQSSKVTVLNDFSQTNYTVVVAAADKAKGSVDSGYPANVRSLKGLRIGIASLGGQLQNLVAGMMQQAGLGADDATFIATGGLPGITAALKNGRVDAQTLTWPSVAMVRKSGVAVTPLIDVARPGNAGPGFAQGLFTFDVASRAFASSDTARLGRYCTAMRNAIAWAKNPANVSAVSEIVAKLDNVRASDIASAWPKVAPTYVSGLSADAWRNQPAWVTGGGEIPAYDKTVTSCAA